MRLSRPPWPLRGSWKKTSRSRNDVQALPVPGCKRDHGRASTQLCQVTTTLALLPHGSSRPPRHTSFIAIARRTVARAAGQDAWLARTALGLTHLKLGKRHSGREAGSQSRESPADRPTALLG